MPNEAQLRAILRVDYVYFAVGILIFTVGVLSILESIVVRPRQRMVLLFGLLGSFYGIRLLSQLGTVQFALGMSPYTAQQVRGVLSYLIPTAGIYLWSTLVSPRSRKILLVAVAAHALFAIVGIPYDFLTHHPWSFPQVNSALVIASSLLTAALFALDIRRGFLPFDIPIRAMAIGFVVFQLGVLYDNLVPLRLVPDLWTEPFCFIGFLFGMGYGIQHKISAGRNRLAMLHAEMEQARRIQLSILPVGSPANSHYRVSANYLPMTSVAGDLYDFIPLQDDRLGLFIADVAGHGLAAALVASMLKTAVNLQARVTASPAELLGELNRLFCAQTHGQFVTAAFAVLEPRAQTLTYSAAGHPPLLMWGSNGDGFRELEQNGLPLGILSNAEYSDVTVPFKPGARLALYTDGIVESENSRDEEFGRDRLGDVLRSHQGDTGELVRETMQAVENWRGREREQADDLTLLIAEHVGNGAQALSS